MAQFNKPFRLALISLVSMAFVAQALSVADADDDDSKMRGGCSGASCAPPGGGGQPIPLPGRYVDSVDPRIADMLEEQARQDFGNHYVDLWYGDDPRVLVLGVFAPTAGEKKLIGEWEDLPYLRVVQCSVSRAELDAAADKAMKLAGDGHVSTSFDYLTGVVNLGIVRGQVSVVASKLTASGFVGVEVGRPVPVSKPGKVVVVVQPEEPGLIEQSLSPNESKTSRPMRAGKEIRVVHFDGTASRCSTGALVEDANRTRFLLSAGHCFANGEAVYFPPTSSANNKLGVGSRSTYNSSAVPMRKNVVADVGRFPAPSGAQASVLVEKDFARNVSGWAMPRKGLPVAIRGRTHNHEASGRIESLVPHQGMGNFIYPSGEVSPTLLRWKIPNPATGSTPFPMKVLRMGLISGTPHYPGDSGAPVYYISADGSAIVVGVHSGSNYFSYFSDALSLTGTSLVTAPGKDLVPLGIGGAVTPFRQIILSDDFTGNGRGEIMVVDNSARHQNLVSFQVSSSQVPVNPAYINIWEVDSSRVYAPGNWDGDFYSTPDVITIDESGKMILHPRTAKGSIDSNAVRKIGQGWQGFTPIPVGDLNGDGIPDLLAIKDATGELLLYAGDGRGGFKFPYPKVGYGWEGYSLYAAGDLTKDGKTDILSIDGNGDLYLYAGRGDGTFRKKVQVGNGWSGYYLAAGADLDGDRIPDIVGRDSAGRLFFYKSKGDGTFEKKRQIASGW